MWIIAEVARDGGPSLIKCLAHRLQRIRSIGRAIKERTSLHAPYSKVGRTLVITVQDGEVR
jgi:hypothetical protein